MRKELGGESSSLVIREYRDSDELAWVRCRVLAFLDTSYRDDIHPYRERYDNPAVQLVAEDSLTGQLVGLLDVEYERKPGDVCNFPGELGGVIWHLAVLPEYRSKGIANQMWHHALELLRAQQITRLEVWTQDDDAANRWYTKRGFTLKTGYLNVYSRGPISQGPMKDLLPGLGDTWKYRHIRSFNFEAEVKEREELEKLSYRLHEVRGYELKLTG